MSTYDPQNPTPPGQDPWSSPLWSRPDTVGGYWDDSPVAEPPAYLAPAAAPAPRRSRAAKVLGGAALVVAGALIGVGIVNAFPHNQAVHATERPSVTAPSTQPSTDPNAQDPGALDPNSLVPGGSSSGSTGSSGTATGKTAYPDAVAAVAPGLVNIISTVGYDGSEAAGTGVVLTSDGVVLTNHHVVAGSTSLKVSVAGTTTSYSADVLGYDSSHDIAVIKLRGASNMTTAPLGDSTSVKVGDTVIGLGNAGGLGGAPIPADGKVTGLNKSITAMDSENGTSEDLTGLIETNAAIQPGDSGGALVSKDGKVVGINTAGSTNGHTTAATDGYAVPINQALDIVQQIRDGKASSTVHIGQSAFLGIQVSGQPSQGNGVRVAGTISGSAATKAGITAGDVITNVDGKTITDNASLKNALSSKSPGDHVRITWTDLAGASHTQTLTLGTGPVG